MRQDPSVLLAALAALTLGPEEAPEVLAPVLRNIVLSKSSAICIKHLSTEVETKDNEIRVCLNHIWPEFSTASNRLIGLKNTTAQLKTSLTHSALQARLAAEEMLAHSTALVEAQQTMTAISTAIDAVTTAMAALDLMARVNASIKRGGPKGFFLALKTLTEMEETHLSTAGALMTHSPLFARHLAQAIPTMRNDIRERVSSEVRQFLHDARESESIVGSRALLETEGRVRRWKHKAQKEAILKGIEVGSAVELAVSERQEFDPLENDAVNMDFTALLQAMLVYDLLGIPDDLRRSFAQDRKTQAELILSESRKALASRTANLKLSPSQRSFSEDTDPLAKTMHNIVGFLLIEQHLLKTLQGFRSLADVQDIANSMQTHLEECVLGPDGNGLTKVKSLKALQTLKEQLSTTALTLHTYFRTLTYEDRLSARLSEQYASLIESESREQFQRCIRDDQLAALVVNTPAELAEIKAICWALPMALLKHSQVPTRMPFSQAYPQCCTAIRDYIDYCLQFTEDVEHIVSMLDRMLIASIADPLRDQLKVTSNISQAGQIVVNLGYLVMACDNVVSDVLGKKISTRGSKMVLQAAAVLSELGVFAQKRLAAIIAEKLDTLSEGPSYEWTLEEVPRRAQPSDYIMTLSDYLTQSIAAIVSDLPPHIQDYAFHSGYQHVASGLIDLLIGPDTKEYSEPSLALVLEDANYMIREATKAGHTQASLVFTTLQQLLRLILDNHVHEYLGGQNRQTKYPSVAPGMVAAVLFRIDKWNTSHPPLDDILQRVPQRRQEMEAARQLTM